METQKVITRNGVGDIVAAPGKPAQLSFELPCDSPVVSAALRIPRALVNVPCKVSQEGDRILIEVNLKPHETIVAGGHTSFIIVAAYAKRQESGVIVRGMLRGK